jgi:hypothetical protein
VCRPHPRMLQGLGDIWDDDQNITHSIEYGFCSLYRVRCVFFRLPIVVSHSRARAADAVHRWSVCSDAGECRVREGVHTVGMQGDANGTAGRIEKVAV